MEKKVDLLAHLPQVGAMPHEEWTKDEILYHPGVVDRRLYLIREGRVVIYSDNPNTGPAVALDIVDGKSERVFGLEALAGPHSAWATCIGKTNRFMSWSVQKVLKLAETDKQLALGLQQALISRNLWYEEQLRSQLYPVAERIALLLIGMARNRRALDEGNNSRQVTLLPMTHTLIGQFVVTSREIVTTFMDKFRSEGFLSYRRTDGIVIEDPEAFYRWVQRGDCRKKCYPRSGRLPRK